MSKPNNSSYNFKSDAFHSSDGADKQKLTHSDLSADADFEDVTDTTFLYDYLMSHERRYMPHIVYLKSGQVRIKTETANSIFADIYLEFNHRIDSVEIFDVITDFFKLDSAMYYQKLLVKYRTILATDLAKRIDIQGYKNKK